MQHNCIWVVLALGNESNQTNGNTLYQLHEIVEPNHPNWVGLKLGNNLRSTKICWVRLTSVLQVGPIKLLNAEKMWKYFPCFFLSSFKDLFLQCILYLYLFYKTQFILNLYSLSLLMSLKYCSSHCWNMLAFLRKKTCKRHLTDKNKVIINISHFCHVPLFNYSRITDIIEIRIRW